MPQNTVLLERVVLEADKEPLVRAARGIFMNAHPITSAPCLWGSGSVAVAMHGNSLGRSQPGLQRIPHGSRFVLRRCGARAGARRRLVGSPHQAGQTAVSGNVVAHRRGNL